MITTLQKMLGRMVFSKGRCNQSRISSKIWGCLSNERCQCWVYQRLISQSMQKCFIPINSERWASGYREIAADFLWGILSKYLHSYYLVLQIEYPFLERLLDGGVPPLGIFPEKDEVAAEIENIEALLIRPVQQSRTQPGAPTDHLPELGPAHDPLEEHQIHHLRHVDAGVQHIHGDCDLWQFGRGGELVDGALDVPGLIIDHLSPTRIGRIVPVKHLQDLFRVAVFFCKNDALTQLIAVVYPDALGHHGIQSLADGIFVEYPLVEGGTLDPVRKDAVLHHLARFVAVGWGPLPKSEDAVGVFVDFRLGRTGRRQCSPPWSGRWRTPPGR